MRTLEDAWLSIERQRAGMAVHGVLPTIVSVEESLAEHGMTIMVIVGLAADDDGGVNYIGAGFEFESLSPAEAAICGVLRKLVDGFRDVREQIAEPTAPACALEP